MRTPSRPKGDWDVLVVGGGIAGLTAAWHAGRQGFATALVECGLHGGQVANVDAIEGWGNGAQVNGATLVADLMAAARGVGVAFVEDRVTGIVADGAIRTVAGEQQAYRARNVVLATGVRPRKLNVEGEARLTGRGVSTCASCDGPLFRGEDVAVIGGGDAALQEALALAELCRSVKVVVRGPVRARRTSIDKAGRKANIGFIWDSEVVAVQGDPTVTGLKVRNVKTGASSDVACTGVFPFIGGVPDTSLLPGAKPGGYSTDGDGLTGMANVYAIGAARTGYCGELAAAAGDAAAAISAIARARRNA